MQEKNLVHHESDWWFSSIKIQCVPPGTTNRMFWSKSDLWNTDCPGCTDRFTHQNKDSPKGQPRACGTCIEQRCRNHHLMECPGQPTHIYPKVHLEELVSHHGFSYWLGSNGFQGNLGMGFVAIRNYDASVRFSEHTACPQKGTSHSEVVTDAFRFKEFKERTEHYCWCISTSTYFSAGVLLCWF